MTRFSTTIVLGLLVVAGPAFAGMGKVFPTYHPAPCSGDDCRADDPRSNKDCAGLLCTFSSSKAMQQPVTAAQAAEAERARAAAAAAAPVEPPPAAAPMKPKTKRTAQAKAPKAPTRAPPPPSAEAAR